jgi:signal transduction histidine kinase
MKKECRSLVFGLFLVFMISSCRNSANQKNHQNNFFNRTELGTIDTSFLEQSYITESLDFALYNAWLNLDDAISSNKTQEAIIAAQNDFLQALEKEKHLKTYKIAISMYGIQNQLQEMELACKNQDAQELSRLVTAFYISKGLIYQKSGTVFMQLIILMGVLILIVMALLFFYQFTYARRIEVEKILSATNKGQEEERRRLALELHDSVAQQMRYVSILAEKITNEELSKEIKKNQSECIENIRNACYTLSSINMDKGCFTEALKNAVERFQKRTKICTSLVITPDADFDVLPQITFHHLFRIIMELLTNIEKHSGAEEVTILIRKPLASDRISTGLMIFISDDGCGIDEKILEAMNSKKVTSIKNLHFGLQNIKLRLNEIGGSIKYVSEKGEGTEVQISIGK